MPRKTQVQSSALTFFLVLEVVLEYSIGLYPNDSVLITNFIYKVDSRHQLRITVELVFLKFPEEI